MHQIAFIQNLSSWEIILIFLVVLLFFGAKRLPDLFRSLGKSLREFKKATSDIEEDIRTAMEEEPRQARSSNTSPKKEAITEPQAIEADDTAEVHAESATADKDESKAKV